MIASLSNSMASREAESRQQANQRAEEIALIALMRESQRDTTASMRKQSQIMQTMMMAFMREQSQMMQTMMMAFMQRDAP